MSINPVFSRRSVAIASILFASVSPVLAQLKAFPEAEGHGAIATGGRGGTVYHVTNLNNSGAGSFRDAVSVSGRTVVFDVGGWIELAGNSPVAVASNVTIAGQTAPGQGIGLKNSGLSFSNRTNVIIRHLRVRPGPYVDAADRDGVSADNASNSIVDHVSASWGRDEVFSVKSSTNITVQHSIIAEGLFNHSMGGLIEGNTGMSIHHSLYINNNDRNPKTKQQLDFVNNVVYNWGAYSYVAGDSAGLSYGNVVGNYFVAGPSSTDLNDPISRGNANYSIYLDGNYWDGDQDALHDGNLLTPTEIDDVLTYVPQRFPYAPVYTDTAQRAYEKVLAGAGASLNRDFTDNRLIGLVQTRTGQIISDPAQVGGWGTLTGGAAPTDTDQDGMPDSWEEDFGLNKNDAADRNNTNLFGYTKLEEYINELGGAHIQRVWTGASGDWTTNPLWAGAQPTVDDNVFIRGNGAATNGIATIGSAGALAWDLRIGGNGAAAGEQLIINAGGTLNVRNVLTVGYQNRGTLQMNGGTAEAPYILLGTAGPLAGTSRIGELKLNGGTLRTTLIAPQGPGGTVIFGGGTIQASGALSITVPVTVNAGGGTIDTNGNTATISALISGSGVLTKSGAGVLELTNTGNTYSGGTTLVGGTLAISSHNNIGGTATPITFSGGLLRLNGTGITSLSAHPINWSTFNGGLDIADPAHIFSLSNVIGGTAFTKAGAGTLVLSGINTHTAGTTVAGGVLSVVDTAQLGATNAPLNLSGGTLRLTTASTSTLARATTLTNASTIDITQAAAVITMSQPIGGTGSLTKLGAGKLVLGSANTYTGQTTISAGTLQITNANALQNSTVNLAGGTLDLNNLAASVGGLAGTGTVDIKGTKLTLGASNQDSVFAGNITSSIGVGSVEKVGTGAIDLTGTNTYTGGTTLVGGTLGITNDSDIGNTATSAITFQGGLLRINGTTLTSMGTHVVNWSTFNGGFDIASAGHTFTVSSIVGGSGAFTKAGAGVLVLNGANTFSGGTILKAGTLSISSDVAGNSNLGGTTRAVTFDGGTLRVSGTGIANLNTHAVNWSTFNGGIDVATTAHTFTISQVLGGAGSLTKAGTGTLALTSANTFTGDTNLTAGVLRLTNANALQNSNLVPGGGVIDLASVTSVNIGGLKGSGAWDLAGETVNVGNNDQNNTYSGVLSSLVAGAAFNKIGAGTLTLSGANSFVGPITIKEGAISISSIAAAGTNSPLGKGGIAGAAAANTLAIDGGTLRYNGGGSSTNDRLFSVGPDGGLVECAGAGPLKFTNTGAIGMVGNGDRTLTFGGVNADCELKFAIGDPTSGKTSFRKVEGGRWILSGSTGSLSYSGDTIIDAGILLAFSAANLLPHGAGKGNLVMNEGQFEMNGRDLRINGLIGGGNINNRTGTKLLTLGDGNASGDFYGTISNGSGTITNVTKIGSGTQIFTGRNRYQGTTTVTGGVLVVNGTHDFNHTGYSVTAGKLEVGGAISPIATPAPLAATGSGLIDINAGGSIRATAVNSVTAITNDGSLATSAGGSIAGITGTGALIVTGGTLNSAVGIRQGSIELSGNATIAVASNGLASGVIKVNTLTIASDGGSGYAGTLQLNNNDLVIDYGTAASPYAETVNRVKKGLTLLGGNGKGIASAAIDAQTQAGTMLAVVDGGTTGGLVTSLSGFPIPNPTTSVLVKYTWRGDANLDGIVNGSDYALADTGFSGGGAGWFYGDMNYDGVINGSDYALIDTGFSSQTGPLPEPGSIAILSLLAGVLQRRRRVNPVN